MSLTTLRVRARGTALVHSLEAMNANPRVFIARKWTTVDGRAALEPTAEAAEIPNRAEYRTAVKEGSLWPADEATAKECGVTFDSFFGESPDSEGNQ
jgi:hypothetical protein